MFTQQHYKKIAEALATIKEVDSEVIEAMVETFRVDNTLFKPARFIRFFAEEYFNEWDEHYNVQTVVSLLMRWVE